MGYFCTACFPSKLRIIMTINAICISNKTMQRTCHFILVNIIFSRLLMRIMHFLTNITCLLWAPYMTRCPDNDKQQWSWMHSVIGECSAPILMMSQKTLYMYSRVSESQNVITELLSVVLIQHVKHIFLFPTGVYVATSRLQQRANEVRANRVNWQSYLQ